MPTRNVNFDMGPTGMQRPAQTRPPRKLSPLILVLSGLLLVAVGVAGYFYWQSRHTQEAANAKEIEDLSKTLGEFMVLPEGEVPTLATVTDKSKLTEQPFFQKAENGDKVLIYTNHGRAILYRPSIKKIIDVTAVNIAPPAGSVATSANNVIPNNPSQPEPGAATPDTLRVAIFNASGQSGATADMEKTVKNFYPKATITTKETATTASDDTLVVDVTGKNEVLTESFSFAVKGKVALLPEGEKTPSGADVLVIIGKNR